MGENTFKNINDTVSYLIVEVNEIKKMLANIQSSNISSQNSENDIIFISDVIRLTNLKKSTIYGYVHHKKIPFFKRKGFKSIMFSRSEIEKWMNK